MDHGFHSRDVFDAVVKVVDIEPINQEYVTFERF